MIEHTRPPQFGGGFRFLGPPIHPNPEMKYPPGVLARLGAGGGWPPQGGPAGAPNPRPPHPLFALLAQFHQH